MNKRKNSNRELAKRNLDLSTLFEISQVFNTSLSTREVLNLALLIPMGRLMLTRAVAALTDENENLQIALTKGLPVVQDATLPTKHLPRAVTTINDITREELRIFMEEQRLHLFVPLRMRDKLCGALFFGASGRHTVHHPDEQAFLEALGNLTAQALENARSIRELKELNKQLDQKIQQLNSLFDIGQEFGLLIDRNEILNRLSFTLMGQLMVNQFFVLDKNGPELRVLYAKGKHFSPEIIDGCLEICRQLPDDFTAVALREESEYNALVSRGIQAVIPMRVQSKIKGFLFLGKRLNGLPYQAADLEYLTILANMTAISLDNAAMIREMIEKKRLEEELAIARAIQTRLIPAQMPELPNYDIHGMNRPSRDVGGDYFDIIPLSETEYLFAIADVSGKGVPAALLMSNLQAALHSLCLNRLPLSTLTAQLNQIVYRNTTMEKFITFFVMTLDLTSGAFRYVNAGHNPPYLFRADGRVEELDEGGLILGIFPDAEYRSGSGTLAPGDLLTMFTDGITEAMNKREEEYEEKRVIEFFQSRNGNKTCAALNEALLADVTAFAAESAMPGDDITILTIRRLA